MKKYILCLLCVLTAAFANAQFVVVGAQGGFGSTWLINNNVSDQAEDLDISTSYAPVFGIELGYLFPTSSNLKLGVIVEGNYSIVNQKYTGKRTLDSVPFTYGIHEQLKYIQVPVLFHITGKSLFFEVGPQFSFLSSATSDFDSSPPVTAVDYSGRDVKVGFNSTVISAAFGFGGHFEVAKNLFIDTRLRFAYGFTDATMDYGSEQARNEAFFLQERIGVATFYANAAQDDTYQYKPTNLATGHLLVGLTYRIPTKKEIVAPTAP